MSFACCSSELLEPAVNIRCKLHPCCPWGSPLTAVTDLRASDFESKEEMAKFFDEEGPSGIDKFVDKLWGKGVNNLTQVGNMSFEAVQSLLDDRSPEIDDFLDFASSHSGTIPTVILC